MGCQPENNLSPALIAPLKAGVGWLAETNPIARKQQAQTASIRH